MLTSSPGSRARPERLELGLPAGPSTQDRFSWLPAVGLSLLFTVLVLTWDPHVRDLAAQTFRTELFERNGFAIWNASWYGGHYTLTYSVLFPPLGALIGPRLVGALAVVASAYLFDRLVRDHWGESAHWATLWFGVGAVSLLVSGQLTFALGVAVGLLTLRCLQRGWTAAALVAAPLCALASPVAAVFLGGVLLAAALSRRRLTGPLVAAGVLAVGMVLALNLLFPDSGQFPFAFSSFIAVPLWCAGALLLTRGMEEEREFRAVVLGYLLASTVVWLAPNQMGGNAIRLGALFGGPLLAAILLTRRTRAPALLIALTLVGSLYWQQVAGVRAVAQSSGDNSAKAAFYDPLRRWLRTHGGDEARIEVPPTANHWEAAYLAPSFALAPRLAAAGGHDPQRRLLRRAPERRRLLALAGGERRTLRRPAEGAARLLRPRRAPADPRAAALPAAALALAELDRLRGPGHGAARARPGLRPRPPPAPAARVLRGRRHPARPLPGARALHPLLVGLLARRMRLAGRRLDGARRLPAGAGPGLDQLQPERDAR